MTFDTPVLAVHYAEIALKGRNRHAFLRRLRNNILVALKGEPVSHVNHIESRLLVRLDDAARADAVATKLQRVFGVQWLSVATAVPRACLGDDLAGLGEVAAALARRDVGNARTFRVDTRRSDRNFPLVSTEINRLVGNAVGEAIQLPVRLHGADFTVHVLMLRNEALIFTQRLPGPGGLPASSGGRVMTLLSGGIDSPVAAWMLMRRGCRSDFIHFYTGRTAAEADAAKILRLVAILREHTPTDLHLYLAPTYPYESRAIGVIAESHDMVLFRRYMLKVAEQLARRTDCHALVTGDSLGQVASQTLYNLGAIGPDVRLPVFRPLIGTDKVEISALARRIGTFETSIEPYRDCCSLRSPHPILRGRAREVLALSERMDMDGAIREALEAVEKMVITEPNA